MFMEFVWLFDVSIENLASLGKVRLCMLGVTSEKETKLAMAMMAHDQCSATNHMSGFVVERLMGGISNFSRRHPHLITSLAQQDLYMLRLHDIDRRIDFRVLWTLKAFVITTMCGRTAY
jgi:hypothetical protein